MPAGQTWETVRQTDSCHLSRAQSPCAGIPRMNRARLDFVRLTKGHEQQTRNAYETSSPSTEKWNLIACAMLTNASWRSGSSQGEQAPSTPWRGKTARIHAERRTPVHLQSRFIPVSLVYPSSAYLRNFGASRLGLVVALRLYMPGHYKQPRGMSNSVAAVLHPYTSHF